MPSPEPAPAPTKRLPVEGGIIVAVAVLCLAFQARLPSLLPAEADYLEVQRVLEAEAVAGDALLVYPWWAERVRLFAPERVTVVGYQGSDADSLELHPRVWVLSQPDLPKASWATFWSAFGPQRTAVGQERTFGRLHLQLYQNGRARPVRFSLTDAIATAQVYLETPDGQRTPCGWDGRAQRCPGGNYVAAEWHEVRFQPRRCLRMFPPGGPTKLVVELPSVPGADTLELMGGFIWDRGYFSDPKYTDTHLTAQVNGTQVAALDYPRGRFGLHRVETGAVPAGASLRVATQTQNPEQRELCVEAYGFGGAAP
ncbi:MAG: hypothetical protein JNK82_02345 [Myxococcaceae bacterium]|nr:hypothetical protein [Myxococcaceae bacterium]